jgi:hypothetical protein
MNGCPEKGRAIGVMTYPPCNLGRVVPGPSHPSAKSVSADERIRVVNRPKPLQTVNTTVCGAGSLRSSSIRTNGGWVKARQRSAASSPEHSERQRASSFRSERGSVVTRRASNPSFVQYPALAPSCGRTVRQPASDGLYRKNRGVSA